MKLYVLVKVYGLVVEGVDVFGSSSDAEMAFKEWTEGLSPRRLTKIEADNFEEKYSQTQILDIELEQINGKSSGKWQCEDANTVG